jgi:hypothetical protein
MSKRIEMLGKKFGKLTVIEESSQRKGNAICWVCRCDCGNITKPLNGTLLRSGQVKSCGCLVIEGNKARNTKHGCRKTRLYSIWANMKRRCYGVHASGYERYGGRGITVCKEWKNDFQAFYDWAMSHGYSDGLTIDRIDVNGNYEPSNCRWETLQNQQRNRRNTILIEDNGELKTVLQLSQEKGISKDILYRRYKKQQAL